MGKNPFLTKKMFKTTKNTIFGLKKRTIFLDSEIKLFFPRFRSLCDGDPDDSNISENPWTPIESMEDVEECMSPEVKKEIITSDKPKSKKSKGSHFMGHLE